MQSLCDVCRGMSSINTKRERFAKNGDLNPNPSVISGLGTRFNNSNNKALYLYSAANALGCT